MASNFVDGNDDDDPGAFAVGGHGLRRHKTAPTAHGPTNPEAVKREQ
jgi:hypothetical protein